MVESTHAPAIAPGTARAPEVAPAPDRPGGPHPVRRMLAGGRPPNDAIAGIMTRAGNRAVQRLLHRPSAPAARLSAPVQLDAAPGIAPQPARTVHQAAAAGLAAPPRALPHASALRRAFGPHRIDGLKAHISPDACEAMGARAYATGDHLVFGRAPSLREVAHEAAHAVQQRGGLRLPGGVGRVGDAHERHADAVADGVTRGRRVSGLLSRYADPRRTRAGGPGPIQRLSMKDHRLIARARSIYDRKALDFELALGKHLAEARMPNKAAELMLSRVQGIVDAWAAHTGQEIADVYEEEFDFPGGDQYYGAFVMSAKNIAAVFRDANKKPLRTKLKVVYNAVRNNNLSKWLKVAADDLMGSMRTSIEVYHRERFRDQLVTVKPGFAKSAGLDKIWHRRKPKELHEVGEREKTTPFGLGRKVHTHGHGLRSDVLRWKPSMFEAHGDREPDVMRGVPLEHQRTITFKELPDLTREEVDQISMIGPPLRVPRGKGGLERFKSTHSDKKVPWAQGSMYYRVIPTSKTAKTARTIRAHLEAGISGSADLMMHAAEQLGLYGEDFAALRLAMLGWMLPNRDHSFFEVMKAAEPYGLPFIYNKARPGLEYQHPTNFKPMSVRRFTALLPEKKFPAYFLTQGYRRTLEPELAAPGAAMHNMGTHFTSLGTSVVDSLMMSAEDFAWADALEADVDRVFDEMGTSEERRATAIEDLRRAPGYTELAVAGYTAEDYLHAFIRARLTRALHAIGFPIGLLPPGAQSHHLRDVLFTLGVFRDAPFTGDRRANARLTKRLRATPRVSWLKGILGATFEILASAMLRAHGAPIESAGFDLRGSGHIASPLIARGMPDFLARKLHTPEVVAQVGQVFTDVRGFVETATLTDANLDGLSATYPEAAAALGTRGFKVAIAGYARRRRGVFQDRSRYPRYADIEHLRTPGGVTEDSHTIDDQLKRSLRMRHDRAGDLDARWIRKSGFARQQLENNILSMGTDWETDHGARYRGLSAGELIGINEYSRLGGMGAWQDAIDEMNPSKRGEALGKLGPYVKAAISGLQRLPVHGGTVYNGQKFDATQPDAMETIKANFPLGRVVRHDNFLSAAKTFGSSFAGSKAGYDLVWVIADLKTARDIQPISTNFGEEEVLFPPGARLLVLGAQHINDIGDPMHGKIAVYMREV